MEMSDTEKLEEIYCDKLRAIINKFDYNKIIINIFYSSNHF
jgi:hypothetical protein